MYYWVCERKTQKETKCTARATTVYIGDQHKIHKFDAKQHNHAPEASQPEALKTCNQMKELAQISNDQPAQIISNIIATTSREIQPCLPRKDALRQQIKRAKLILPSDAEPIIQWFENNYAHGRIKRILRNGRVQRHNPLYPPEMWSVFDNMEFAFPRTQNKVEAWHRRWKTLIARAQ
ncbi:unnamed protein product, partial [Rotaria sp. Silwood2]